MTPDELLRTCRETEDALGRVRKDKWGARTLDVDIILYGEQVVSQENLEIPHPRFRDRLFVLLPASQIAPDMIDPVTEKSVLCLMKELMRQKPTA